MLFAAYAAVSNGEPMTELGAILRATRLAKGLSLSVLARRTHYSKPYLSQLENGHRAVSEEHVAAYEDALGVSVWHPDQDVSVAGLMAALAEVRKTEDDTDPMTLLSTVQGQREAVLRLPRTPDSVRLLSSVEQYLGWLAMRLEKWKDAQGHLDRAAMLALEADDPMRLSTAMSYTAYLSELHGNLQAASGQCEAAARDDRLHVGFRSYLRYQQAEILGSSSKADAKRALSAAEELAEKVPDKPGPWNVRAFYTSHRALSLDAIGDRSAAREAASEALETAPATWWEPDQPLRIRQTRRRIVALL